MPSNIPGPSHDTRQHLTVAALRTKVAQRLALLDPAADLVRVLDAYGGDGDVWRHVATLTDTRIEVTSVDQRSHARTQLTVDNRRFIASVDLSRFDLVDLDAWGFPAEQLALVADQQYAGTVTYTAIALGLTQAPAVVLAASGIPHEWRAVAQRLVSTATHPADAWLEFCSRLGYPHHVLADDRSRPPARYLYGACGNLEHWTPARQAEADATVTKARL